MSIVASLRKWLLSWKLKDKLSELNLIYAATTLLLRKTEPLATGITSLTLYNQSSLYIFKCFITDRDRGKIIFDSEQYVESNGKLLFHRNPVDSKVCIIEVTTIIKSGCFYSGSTYHLFLDKGRSFAVHWSGYSLQRQIYCTHTTCTPWNCEHYVSNKRYYVCKWICLKHYMAKTIGFMVIR